MDRPNLPCVAFWGTSCIAVEWCDIADEEGEPDPLPPEPGVRVVYADRSYRTVPLRAVKLYPSMSTRAMADIAEDYAHGRCCPATGPLFVRG